MSALPDPLAPLREPTPRLWRWLLPLMVMALLTLPTLLLLPPLLGLPRYEVQAGTVVARSLGSTVRIEQDTPVQRGPVTLRGKLVGSNADGYVVGRFGSEYGTLNVYSDGSQGADALLFATQPRPTLLTPAHPDTLLTTWRRGDSATFAPARRAGYDLLSLGSTLLILPILALLLAPRKPIRYELDRSGADGGALVIHTGASQTRLPLTSTEARLTSYGLGVRLLGTGLPGYYTGTFSIAGAAVSAGRVQAAATSAKPPQALLLTHGGKTYYLTPSDPEVVAGWFGHRPKDGG
ncbi:hypothetical protein GCM10017783_15810 [Deinococcus piscis]|uniref:Bacterial Pleckstrin homology domain-containing protein n=1 Tax=Deinococcus piscis TaxID=394230 RepID=A0ABQ3K6H9_9DEIO|nr:PH domain-containing protein [Deinococcus piscis]GHG04048.1 hypothetical protein GCM10017783_15810 [Deinococcus piscis]